MDLGSINQGITVPRYISCPEIPQALCQAVRIPIWALLHRRLPWPHHLQARHRCWPPQGRRLKPALAEWATQQSYTDVHHFVSIANVRPKHYRKTGASLCCASQRWAPTLDGPLHCVFACWTRRARSACLPTPRYSINYTVFLNSDTIIY